ncbi:gfo/Idh/MocA family oxidoreductase [Alteromonas sediminis]|uniref:Gfo/Idh/MocA family oxidoreductase n=1 Tax=Alteromonas sediminis TaxID=2259342 RepID=A0A3N5Y1E2_9ALTE|nr:Gfo/Idh/MocA family oxidoreductase [Alteromonas sediminis]RPJ66783.1 gfo/Idh/MocA family oxidoreductase [Alteromonas sediminis]
MSEKRKVKMGMIGGGQGAFIGQVHRIAAAMDSEIELVCGAFSSDPEKSILSGKALYLDPSRCYPDFNQMLQGEAALPASERMEFVAIVTPNHLHYEAAKCCLEAGFHVLCDKPATFSLKEAIALKNVVHESGKLFGLTHTYLGYPMVKRAKELVAQGELGTIRKIMVEYQQGWLSQKEDEDSKQAAWRLDPAKAGISCCMGDIGVHAANLAEYVSGEKITALCADLGTVVDGRRLDDDGAVFLRFSNKIRGTLLASQIAIGEENNLTLRLYGDKASLHWQQEEPNTLIIKRHNASSTIERSGIGEGSSFVTDAMRVPAGHPEGYIEAFANLYRDFAHNVKISRNGTLTASKFVPGIEDALRGMAFIEHVVAADRSDTKWHDLVTTHSPFKDIT